MKTIFGLLALVAAVGGSPARAETQADTLAAEFGLNKASPEAMRKYQLGTKIMKNRVFNLKCKYDFAVQGGAVGSVNLLQENGQACVIPKYAIIQNVLIDVITQGATSASGTMELTAQSAGDLKAALAAASYTGLVAGIPVDTAATAIKMTADRTIVGTIATGALTAGKWYVHVRYIMSDI